jgi:hypothetical protein
MKSPAKSPGKPADDDRSTASADLDGSHDMVEELASAAMQAAGLRKFSPQFNAFVLYLFFLAIFNTVVFGPRNSDPFYMRQSLDDMFLGNEYDYGIDYHGTASIAQVWQWIDSIMLPNLYPDSWCVLRVGCASCPSRDRMTPHATAFFPLDRVGTTGTRATATTSTP